GLLENDVAPELHPSSPGGYALVELEQEVEVHAVLAALLDPRLAPALAELPRLVAADVEGAAAEVRQQFVVERIHEVERLVVGLERAAVRLPAGVRVLEAVRAFREMLVGLVAQPALHVPEGVLVRHE